MGGGWARFYPVMAHPPAPGDFLTPQQGVAYHPPSKRFAFWDGGGDILWLDPGKLTITRQTAAPRSPVPPKPTTADNGGNGVFGRWAYMPQYDAFIGYANPTGNVWVWMVS